MEVIDKSFNYCLYTCPVQMVRLMSELVSGDKQPSVDSPSGARKMEKITLKAHTKAFLFALLIASIYLFAYAVKGIVLLFSFEHTKLLEN